MVGALLTRGMLVGILAGILSFGFLKLVGEPPVDRAIAFETAMDDAKDHTKADHVMTKGMTMPKEDTEPELVSRSVQSGIGLFTGVAVYNTAFGGLFALVFAFAYRRMGDFDPKNDVRAAGHFRHCRGLYRSKSEIPGQPAIGWRSETIGMRTALYFAMIAISLAAMIASWMLRNRLVPQYGRWNAALTGIAAYLIVVVAAGLALPAVNEVPEAFPAVVLWQFRMASAGAQLVMWSTIGLAFGVLAEGATAGRSGLRLKATTF